MGINNAAKDCFPLILEALGVESWKGVSILEYGNQLVRDMPERTSGKEFFTAFGARHVSIDINGKDGVLNLDLRKPLKYIGEPFDLVTNFGTTEHVQGEQYQPFKTMHDMVKPGGIMLSIVPSMDYLKKHGFYKYRLSFFEQLAWNNGHKILKMEYSGKKEDKRVLVASMTQKVKTAPFISEDIFSTLKGIVRHDKGTMEVEL